MIQNNFEQIWLLWIKKGSKFFWRQIMKFKIILKGEESAFVPWEVSKKIRVRCRSARRCSRLKMHFQIFQTERNKEKCNPVIPQPYGFSPVSIDVIQFSDELQIQNLLKSYYKFYKIICPFEGGFTLWQQPFFCRQFS